MASNFGQVMKMIKSASLRLIIKIANNDAERSCRDSNLDLFIGYMEVISLETEGIISVKPGEWYDVSFLEVIDSNCMLPCYLWFRQYQQLARCFM